MKANWSILKRRHLMLVSVEKEYANSALREKLTGLLVIGNDFTQKDRYQVRYAGLPFMRSIVAQPGKERIVHVHHPVCHCNRIDHVDILPFGACRYFLHDRGLASRGMDARNHRLAGFQNHFVERFNSTGHCYHRYYKRHLFVEQIPC